MLKELTKIYEGADLAGATSGVIFIPVTEVLTVVGSNIFTGAEQDGDAVFELERNGTVVGGYDALTVPDGSDEGGESPAQAAVSKGDRLVLNLLSGAVQAPITLNLLVQDGQATAGNATHFRNVELASGAPQDGDAYVYSEAEGKFVPAPVGGNSGAGNGRVGIDATPASPSAYDDEFDSSTLDPQWTETNFSGAVPTREIDGDYKSLYLLKFGGSQGVRQLTQAFTPGAADFSVTLKCLTTLKSGDGIMLYAWNGAETAAVRVGFYDASYLAHFSEIPYVGMMNEPISALLNEGMPHLYLHLQRVGGVWTAYLSVNGIGWRKLSGSSNLSVTVEKLQIQITSADAAAIDWFRVNYLFL